MPADQTRRSASATSQPDATETGGDQADLRALQLQRRAQQARKADNAADQATAALVKQGVKDPQKYAALLTQYPDSSDAILKQVGQAFGAAFVAQVKAAAPDGKDGKDAPDAKGDAKDGGKDGGDDKPLLSHDFAAGKNAQVEVSGGESADENGAYATADLQNKDGSKSVGVTGYVNPFDVSQYGANVHGTAPVGKDGSVTGKVGVGADQGKPQVSGEVDYKDSKNDASLQGTVSDKDNYDVQASEEYKINDKVSVTGTGERKVEDGAATNTVTAGADYGGDKVAAGGEVDVTKDASGVGVEAKGSGTVSLKDGKLYGTVLAGGGLATDGSTIYHFGGGLTFTPTENLALTAAGVMSQDGGINARLQLDVFKDKVQSASDLSDDKKKALVSLFVEYSHNNGGDSPFNDEYGAPDYSRNLGGGGTDNQVTAGITFRF